MGEDSAKILEPLLGGDVTLYRGRQRGNRSRFIRSAAAKPLDTSALANTIVQLISGHGFGVIPWYDAESAVARIG